MLSEVRPGTAGTARPASIATPPPAGRDWQLSRGIPERDAYAPRPLPPQDLARLPASLFAAAASPPCNGGEFPQRALQTTSPIPHRCPPGLRSLARLKI